MTTRSITMTGLVTTLATLATSARGRSFATSYSARASNGSSMRWTNSTNNCLLQIKMLEKWSSEKVVKWSLFQVYPELFIPGEAVASGEARNEWSNQCIDRLTSLFQSVVQLWVWPHVWLWFINLMWFFDINSSTALVRERTYTSLWVFGLVIIREATNTGCSVNRERSGWWLLHLATWYQSLHMCQS